MIGGGKMSSLSIGTSGINVLRSKIEQLEKINGTSMYAIDAQTDYSCNKWDCFVSCNCANSRD